METWYRINTREITRHGSTAITPEDFERSTPQYLIAQGGFRTAKFGKYHQFYPSLEEAQEAVIVALQRAVNIQETAIEVAKHKKKKYKETLKRFRFENR